MMGYFIRFLGGAEGSVVILLGSQGQRNWSAIVHRVNVGGYDQEMGDTELSATASAELIIELEIICCLSSSKHYY